MKLSVSIAIFCCLLLTVAHSIADLKAGLDAFEAGKYDTAKK